jgi:hypothetical protein
MGGKLRAAVAVAFLQGVLLSWLHHLAENPAGSWSELSVLLPAYASAVGVSKLELLARLYARIVIPGPVWSELVEASPQAAGKRLNGTSTTAYPAAMIPVTRGILPRLGSMRKPASEYSSR